ncbi:MAG TPA: hypothetical protein VGL93_32850 [Streptosporangiaceae bacterium]|jgi:peptidoglycan/LPS O-acetylase OafA/YrhL
METVRIGGNAVAALRTLKVLLGAFLALSVLNLLTAYLLRDDAGEVNDAVWIRGTFVLASAVTLLMITLRVARGSRPAYRRARIISVVVLVAIAVVASWPGLLPVWMRVEQVVCGLLLLGVVAVLFGPRLRAAFAGA